MDSKVESFKNPQKTENLDKLTGISYLKPNKGENDMPVQYQQNGTCEKRPIIQIRKIMLKLADIMAMEHLITPDEKFILQELIEKDEEL